MDDSYSNMWQILIRNWNHFYWLTGEIPPTFNLLMDELQEYLPRKSAGQTSALDIENQVWNYSFEYPHHFSSMTLCSYLLFHRSF